MAWKPKTVDELSKEYGIDLSIVTILLQTFGPILLEFVLKLFLKKGLPTLMAASRETGHACPEHVLADLEALVESTGDSYLKAVCAYHCASCDH